MTRIYAKSEEIRQFILNQVDKHTDNLAKITAEHFGVTRQAINKHLKKLTEEELLIEYGNTQNKTYKLASILEWEKSYEIIPEIGEDVVWRKDIRPILENMPDNVIDIWYYSFTEMFNNAIDHSDGTHIIVRIKKTAVNTEIIISDNGVGIFKKIQSSLNLLDERHAVLELSKGKLTTDPKHHSGEGIFFTSRMCDCYDILSGEVHFSHQFERPEDWIVENKQLFNDGTIIWMTLNNHTARTQKEIFDQYTTGENYGFNKTVVPVKLAQYGNERLISRSQAKRLLARIELFKIVIFDFEEVNSIGQAFADEIFRVFANQNPQIRLIIINASDEVEQMINRAKAC